MTNPSPAAMPSALFRNMSGGLFNTGKIETFTEKSEQYSPPFSNRLPSLSSIITNYRCSKNIFPTLIILVAIAPFVSNGYNGFPPRAASVPARPPYTNNAAIFGRSAGYL